MEIAKQRGSLNCNLHNLTHPNNTPGSRVKKELLTWTNGHKDYGLDWGLDIKKNLKFGEV